MPQKSITSRPRITSASAMSDTPTLSMIERVARREIHPPALIDDRSLQCFGQFDSRPHSGGVRATRSAINTGFSAATSSRAVSAIVAESPCGADGRVPSVCAAPVL